LMPCMPGIFILTALVSPGQPSFVSRFVFQTMMV
jgi:hypothetical protein